jgi:hypothetical protein
VTAQPARGSERFIAHVEPVISFHSDRDDASALRDYTNMTDWRTLDHAYGNAADIPGLLNQLTPEPEASVWEELWSRICHQGTVYSASFAALPALADAAERWKPKERAMVIALAASIVDSEEVHGGCREDLLHPVEWVVPRLQRSCWESLAETGLSKGDFIYLLQAARAFEGDRFWGRELDHLASGEFPGNCPDCGVDLYLVIGEYGFFTTAEEWVERTGSTSGAIEARQGIKRTPIEMNNDVLAGAGQLLYEHAVAAQQAEVADWIRYVFGTSECPSCGHHFAVQDAIAEQ